MIALVYVFSFFSNFKVHIYCKAESKIAVVFESGFQSYYCDILFQTGLFYQRSIATNVETT